MIRSLKSVSEKDLWRSRLPELVITFVSILIAFGLGYVITVDTGNLLNYLSQRAAPTLAAGMDAGLELNIAAEAIKVLLDVYLIAVLLVIFASSLSVLFVNKNDIGVVGNLEFAPRLFLARSVGNLKKWLIGAILLRLVLNFIQRTVGPERESTLDLVYLAVVVLLVGSALFLSRRRSAARD
ncbi:MAG: YqhA family protein [Anaerolineae bacterium]|nr:YqhA family protein [Anaerolineae bacterium]